MQKIAILLMFIPFSLSAVNWVVVQSDEDCTYRKISIDVESIRKEGDTIYCWFRYDYCGKAREEKIVELYKFKRELFYDDEDYKPSEFSYEIFYREFNIKLYQSTLLSQIEYTIDGSAMYSFKGEGGDYSYIVPGSVGESLIKYAKEAYSKYKVQK